MKRQRFTHAAACSRLLGMIVSIYDRRGANLMRKRQEVGPSAELQALCANAISVDEYLMLKLEAAIEPLNAFVRPEHVAAVRAAMRERLRTEPGWVKVIEEIRQKVLCERAAAGHGEPPGQIYSSPNDRPS